MSKDYDGVFVCTECHSDQIIDPYKNLWVQGGQTPPCKFCGGVVIFIDDETARQNALKQSDRQRGIPPTA